MNQKPGFAPPVGGMRRPSPQSLRDDLDDLSDIAADSPLDLQILRLMALHGLKVCFRNQDLASLGDPTKRALLDDMNCVLGIQPLRKFSP